MTRVLPGVYVTFKDYSVLPEGETNLNVGYVLAAPRGPIGKAELVTSPIDFLTKFTLSGSPTIKDDKTFWSILQVLKYTNMVYVSRAAKNALCGGITFGTTKATPLADGIADPANFDFTAEGHTADLFLLAGINGGAYNNKLGIEIISYKDQPSLLVDQFENLEALKAAEAFQIRIYDYTNASAPALLETYLVSLREDAKSFDGSPLYIETVLESSAYIQCVMPDPARTGAPASTLGVRLKSAAETPITLGNFGSEAAPNTWTYNPSKLKWISSDTTPIEYPVADFKSKIIGYSGSPSAGDIIEIAGTKVLMAGGSDGDVLTANDCVKALGAFEDKTIPVSLLGNGSGTLYENPIYQQALISLADQRKDCMVFLNTKEQDEKATLNSTKASSIVKYKKEDLGSTSYFGCMYGPHVNYSDVFNSRQVKLGADATAIAGWLNVLLNQGYPFAYAGPQYGLVSGVTTNWKIGDTSGEATILNDASINYVSYDAKVGRYYMQCQNTLQIANSSLRNIGAVLNILDIKQTFMTFLKEYLQLPITTRLREEIYNKCDDYMKNSILGMSRCTGYAFADVTTDTDLSNNELRYCLAIALTPYAQKIYLDMNILPTGFDFTITQGA